MRQETDKIRVIIRKAGIMILVLCLTAVFSSCMIRRKTPEEKELDKIVRYLVKNAGSEDIKAGRNVINKGLGKVTISIGGVADLEHTDNIALAMNMYLEENPESFIIVNRYRIEIVIEKTDELNHNPPKRDRHYYAELEGDVVNVHRETGDKEEPRINRISVQVTPPVSVSEFLKCKVKYEHIVFSQAMNWDALEELASADSIKSVCLRELGPGDQLLSYSIPEFVYETYSSYCELASRINEKKGFKFAQVSLLPSTKDNWQKEYGKKFAKIEAVPQIDYKLTLNDDYSITRDEHDDDYYMLCWLIKCDGETVLQRLALGELVLLPEVQWHTKRTGTFNIYLIAFLNGEYTRVSNIIEYTITEPPVTPAGAALFLRINGKSVPVKWEDNDSVRELKRLSLDGMKFSLGKKNEHLLRGMIERVIRHDDSSIEVSPGDLVLFSGNWFGACFASGKGIYTRLGKIDLPENEIRELFSKDDTEITIIWGLP